MHKTGRSALSTLASFAAGGLLCLAAAVAAAGGARSQEIEPYEFVPAPAGTNLLLGYYNYGHATSYNFKNGPTIKNSGVEVNVALARYVHFFDLAGHPAVVQVLQPFGSLSGAHIGGTRLGSAFGAQDTYFGGAFWPYSNQASKTYVITDFFVYVPDGTYDPHSLINLGDNRWSGNLQIGLSKGIGDHFSFDVSFDSTIYGSNNQDFPGNRTLTQDNTYRGQIWLNWAWSRAFFTSLGWEGLFGGAVQANGFPTGGTSEEQRLRAAAGLYLSTRSQVLLEVNHDVQHTGNFKQVFGLVLRGLYVF